MAEDLDFDSFDNLDDLDWSELEKDHKEGAQEAAAPAKAGPAQAAPAAAGGGPAAAPAAAAGGPAAAPGDDNIGIDYLLDVELQITVEVGRRLYYVSDILSWDPGSIIELDKIIGEPLNLLINGKPVARGEVVVANDKFALRIVEILDPHDRVAMLQG